MSQRPRVLLLSEAANPDWVSVPLVGWSLANALREVADVHLLTQVRNRDPILRAGLVEGQDVTFIDTEPLLRHLYRLSGVLRMGKGKGWTTVTALNSLAYPYFEHLVWKQFGAALQTRNYDIVHRITPLTPTAVSSLAAKCKAINIPFIMGPLNGGVPWPSCFDNARRKEREWLSYVRDAYKLLPGRKRMLASAGAIVVGSRHTESEIPDTYHDKTFWIPENAIDPRRFTKASAHQGSGPLKAAFIGRLVPYKGLDMLLEAAQDLLRNGHMTLQVIGDGPMRDALAAQVDRDGLAASVTFHGFKSHHEVQDILAEADILSFPSIREFGGGVVLEAMALGVVPVVVDYAGPGELVDDTVGYKVPIGSRAGIISGFTDVLTRLSRDRSELPGKSATARDRVSRHFTWSAKARQVSLIYDWLMDPSLERPHPLNGM